MTREGLAGFNVAVFAGQLYRDLLRGASHGAPWEDGECEDFARVAFAQAAAFLRVAKRHDLTTGEPNGLPADVEMEPQP